MVPRSGVARVLGWLLVTIAAGCLAIAAAVAFHTQQWIQQSLHANGEVVALVPRQSHGKSHAIVYAPVFRFAANDGKIYTIPSRTATSPPGFTIGQSIDVLYPSGRPQDARIAAFWQLWLGPLVLAAIAVPQGLIGCAYLYFAPQAKRTSSRVQAVS